MTDPKATKKTQWGRSYGQMVAHEFFKRKLNVISLGFIMLLFFIAVFAPFIANDKPYLAKMADGQIIFPLFANLSPTDYSILLAGAVGLVQLVMIMINKRRLDPSARSEVLTTQIIVNAAILIVGIILLFIFIPKRLDAKDYRQMLQNQTVEAALFPPVPFGFDRTELAVRELPPNSTHWLGTDDVGSDVLARLIHGSRISLSVGFVAVGISSLMGIFLGSLMGYFGGKTDFLGMRLVEIMMAVPKFFLIITIVAFFPRSLLNIMIIIGITSWTGDARFIRAEFLRLRNQDFVLAARALGLPLRSILFKHMLPNGIAPVLVNATFGIAGAIFIEAALSFLGFGVAPPTPSWGQMLSLGVGTTGRFLWWLSLFPGLAIFMTVLAYNLLGEGLRDAIDPKLRKAA